MKESDKRWVIVDLDGTLVDSSHRYHLVPEKKYQADVEAWEAFEHLWYLDSPHDDVFELVKAMAAAGFYIAIVTSRNERRMEDTVVWLLEWGVPFEEIHMRAKDGVPPEQVKGEIVMEHFVKPGRKVVFALEDDEAVVDAYRWIGVMTLRVRRNHA